MKSKNILTVIVALFALILAVVVVLVKNGTITRTPGEEETVIESTVIEVSVTNAHGEIEYLTMVETYVAQVTSIYDYPARPTSSTKEHTTEPVSYVEKTSSVQVLDENGNPVLDENGQPVTEVVSYTEVYDPDATEPSTAYVPKTDVNVVTDIFKRPMTDENGNQVTEYYTVEAIPPEYQTIWEEETVPPETKFPQIELTPERDDALANKIITQINAARGQAGLPYLENTLSGTARGDSSLKANGMTDGYSGMGSMFETTYGGQSIYTSNIEPSMSTQILNPDATQIGVGVYKFKGVYYTTVIIQ